MNNQTTPTQESETPQERMRGRMLTILAEYDQQKVAAQAPTTPEPRPVFIALAWDDPEPFEAGDTTMALAVGKRRRRVQEEGKDASCALLRDYGTVDVLLGECTSAVHKHAQRKHRFFRVRLGEDGKWDLAQ